MRDIHEERLSMSEHDLLIRIDERVETLTSEVKKMNGVRPRIARLEAIVTVLLVVMVTVLPLVITGTI